MKTYLLLATIIFLNISSIAQLRYEKGYFIDNNGLKTECLIENLDWRDNPTSVKLKRAEGQGVEIKTIENIQEFAIYGDIKFERKTVKIDRSSGRRKNFPYNSSASPTEETLFLALLIEGKANLYQYTERSLNTFFFNKDQSDLKQLIAIDSVNRNKDIVRDKKYIKQLFTDLKCPDLHMEDYESLAYNSRSLSEFFIAYNTCIGASIKDYTEQKFKIEHRFYAKLGLGSNSISITQRNSLPRVTEFGFTPNFKAGLEGEFFLSNHKKKWAFLVELAYQQLKTDSAKFVLENVLVDYKALEGALGLRYYLFSRAKIKPYLNLKYTLNVPLKSGIFFEDNTDLDVSDTRTYNFGAGALFKEKFSVEFNYGMSRALLRDYVIWSNRFTTISFIFGYRFR